MTMGERHIPAGARVIDLRPGAAPERLGTVWHCDRLGHFGDPWYLAAVRWDDRCEEPDINTCWLKGAAAEAGGPS